MIARHCGPLVWLVLTAVFFVPTQPLIGQEAANQAPEQVAADEQSAGTLPKAENQSSAASANLLSHTPTTTHEGVRAFIDPVTGLLTSQPTLEQKADFLRQASADRSSKTRPALTEFRLRQGGVGVKLDDRFHSSLRLEPDRTGGWRLRCDKHEDHDQGDPSSSISEPVAVEEVQKDSVQRDSDGNLIQ